MYICVYICVYIYIYNYINEICFYFYYFLCVHITSRLITLHWATNKGLIGFSVCLWVFCLHTNLSTISVLGAYRGQKRAANLLEMGLQMGMKHHVGAGNQTQVL